MGNTGHRLKMMMLIWITSMFCNKIVFAQMKDISQPNPMISADVGDNVTLHCYRLQADKSGSIVWYKQNAGDKPRVMVTVQHDINYEDEFKPPKFSIEEDKRNGHLKIANVETSDEAMYYCGYRKFLTRFGNGTYLSVRGDQDVKVSVFQSSVSDSVPAGASVTLQCSVLSESRAAELQVLWFRAAPSQSHPQIIYTHQNSSLQCESESSKHTCVYNLSKNIFSLNDTGTYYCAVALCGKIIFGNGTRVQLEKFERSVNPVVIGLAVALGVCVLVICALIFQIKRNYEKSMVKLKQDSKKDKRLNKNRDENVELNYAALHFTKKRTKRGRGKTQQTEDIIYSDVRRLSVT